MTIQRIKGKSVYLSINSVVYTDVTSVALTKADSDIITFGDVVAGTGYDWTLSGTCPVDNSAASFFTMLETNVGMTGVAFIYGANGNSTPSSTKPHYDGTLSFDGPPDISVTAAHGAGSTATYDFAINVDSTPTRSSTV